jgi:hypothetical protein
MKKSLALALVTSSVAFAAWSHDAQATVVLSDNFTSTNPANEVPMDNWQGDSVFTSMPDPSVHGSSSVDLVGSRQWDSEFPQLGAVSHVECRGLGRFGRHWLQPVG